MFWSGIALGVLGVVAGVVAGVRSDNLQVVCVHSANADPACGGSGEFQGLFSTPAYGGPDTKPRRSGPDAIPLILGLTTGGAAMASGTVLFGSEDDFPWIQVVLGGVLLVSSLVVGALADGTNAVDARNN